MHEAHPKRHLDRFRRFGTAELTEDSSFIVQWAAPFHLKIDPRMGIWTRLKHASLGPTKSHHNPNVISIGSAVFAEITSVTDRPTDRPTDHATPSEIIGRIYVRSTAIRPVINTRTYITVSESRAHLASVWLRLVIAVFEDLWSQQRQANTDDELSHRNDKQYAANIATRN